MAGRLVTAVPPSATIGDAAKTSREETMGIVIQFPSKSVGDWAVIERSMKNEFSRLNTPPRIQGRLIEQMKAFYQLLDCPIKFSIDISFPDDITQAQTSLICHEIGKNISGVIEEQFQAFTNTLIIDRLHRELEFCHV
jgi:hypothetical protein